MNFAFHISRLTNFKLVRHFCLNRSQYQKKNHYDSLGLTPKATQGDVKAAYYKLSKLYHPDLNKDNPSASDQFRDISTAYEVLGNLKSRRLYDRELTVRGYEENYNPHDPVKDTLQHASFYHHRNKPSNIKNASGGNIGRNYNVDEWTKAHYSETFSEACMKKATYQQNLKEKMTLDKEYKSNLQVIAVILCVVICGFFFGASIKNDNFDRSYKQDIEPKNN